MKVNIADLGLNMSLGNNGIMLDVYDNKNNRLGDLRIGKGTIEWCKGKTQKGNGVKVSWKELITFFEDKQ